MFYGRTYNGGIIPDFILRGKVSVRKAFLRELSARNYTPDHYNVERYINALHASIVSPEAIVGVAIDAIIDEHILVDTYDLTVEGSNEFVIDGGIISHNSSEIALSEYGVDNGFLDLKNYAINPERAAWGWASNNSVVTQLGANYKDIAQRIANNGEPGVFWLDTARRYGRLSDPPDNKDIRAKGTNPSLRRGTRVLTDTGIMPIELLEKTQFKVRNLTGEWSAAECFLSGRNKLLYKITFTDGHVYYATAEHEWPVKYADGWNKVKTTDLLCGMQMPFRRNTYITTPAEPSAEGITAGKHMMTAKSTPVRVWGADEAFRRGYLAGIISVCAKIFLGRCVIQVENNEVAADLSELLGFYGIRNTVYMHSDNQSSARNKDAHNHSSTRGNNQAARNTRNVGTDRSTMLIHSSARAIGERVIDTYYTVIIADIYSLRHLADVFGAYQQDLSIYMKYPEKDSDKVVVLEVVDSGLHEEVWDITVHDDTHCFQLAYCMTGNCCFHGDTKIVLADGRPPTSIAKLAKDGKDVPVYTLAPDGTICIQWAMIPHKTGDECTLVDVEFIDGSHIEVTPEHKFPANGGIYYARELQCMDQVPFATYASLVGCKPPMEMNQTNDVEVKCEMCNMRMILSWDDRNTAFCSTDCQQSYWQTKYPPEAKHIIRCKSVKEMPGKHTVYNLTVPGTHIVAVAANTGVIFTYQSEQTLESTEMCNLVETYPSRHETREDFIRTLKFAYLYAKTVTLGGSHWVDTNRIMMRNRRIGCSVSGITELLARIGVYETRKWLRDGYDEIQKWDKIYSDYLAIPRSIRTTSEKPSGTVSLLAGVTPGAHFPNSRYYIRRMRLMKDSPLIPDLLAAGYNIEPCIGSEKSTVVVEVPISAGNNVRTNSEVSIWEKAEVAAMLQADWADNQVSITVDFDAETESSQIEPVLNYYQYRLKSISFLPRYKNSFAYPQMPYEEISKEKFEELNAKLKPLNFHITGQNAKDEVEIDTHCDGEGCLIPRRKK